MPAMRKSNIVRGLLSLLLLLLVICISTGCAANREHAAYDAHSEIETPSGFSDAAVPVTGSENLSEIHSDFLQKGEYSAALELGGNLLLVRMYVSESENAAAADVEEWEYEEHFCYQFDLYSLKDNAVTASLNTEETSGDFYQIVGSELYLMDYEENVLRRYDANLSLLGTYDASDLMNAADCFLYASSDADSCYVIDYEDHTMLKVTFIEDHYMLSECETDYYCSYISMSSPDASKLLLHTVDKDTFFSGSRVVNTSNLSDVLSYSQDGFFFGVLSDEAFLTQLSDGIQPYMCSWFDGETVYFAEPAYYNVSLMGGLISAARDGLYDYESGKASYDACVYDCSGACVSAMSYNGDRDGDGETDIYIPSEPVYFEEYNCALILTCDVEEGAYLLVWDLGTSGTADDMDNLTFYAAAEDVPAAGAEDGTADNIDPDANGTTVTKISDRNSYDWGDLAGVRTRADALEEAYGISIYLGPEVPSLIGSAYSADQCLNAEVLTAAMDVLAHILELYPENFFPQLCYDDIQGIRIYLAGTLSGSSEGLIADPTGYVTDVNHYKVMVLDATQYWDWDYTVNHEISHMIDSSLDYRSTYQQDPLYAEETWSSYNPIDFAYLYTYDEYQYNIDYETWPDYFVDYYGTTYPTEDRAEIFGYVMADALNDGLYEYLFTENEGIRRKLNYYNACIRDGFDTTDWPEVLSWERYAE